MKRLKTPPSEYKTTALVAPLISLAFTTHIYHHRHRSSADTQ